MTNLMSLALRFDSPMQSWGIRSRGVIRDTMPEPTKSGVVGLLAAALGLPRTDDQALTELAGLTLGVRVDREGTVERDYHVTQNVPTTQGTGHRTVVSERYYLADALFLVVLQGDERLLVRLADAVRAPHWPLSFGRKAFVPAAPLLGPDAGPTPADIDTVLTTHPWLVFPRPRLDQDRPASLRTVVDCAVDQLGAHTRHDHPLSFADGHRRFRARSVVIGEVSLTDDMLDTQAESCI